MIVAGAGIIGLSCAWRLAQQGHAVTIFDAREAACEASWAGAGMLAPGGEFEVDSAPARLALQSLREYPAFVEELEEEAPGSIDFRRSGGMEVALTDAESEELDRRARSQESFGIHSEPRNYGGRRARFYPDDAIVDPRDVTRALRVACRNHGVAIHENEPVLRIGEGGKVVETASGRYASDGVVIAAGAWSGALYPGLPRTMPVRGHLVAWRRVPGLLEPILRHGGTYLLQRRSGLLIAGSTTEHRGFDRTIDTESVRDIQARTAILMPELASEAPYQTWNGFRPGIEGVEPLIGRVPGSCVWTAFGHYRNGILLAPATARLIAESAGRGE